MFQNLIKPNALKEGDKIAAITLSWGGPGTFPHRYEAGKRQLEETFNVEVVETRHALKPADWIYNNPQARAEDMMEAFSDPSIKAIIATIGGEESVRILPHLDISVLKKNPKIFMGYSDTTVAHFACFKAGLTSFYGPSIMSGFAENGGIFPYMEKSVRDHLFSATPVDVVEPNNEGWTVEHLDWSNPENQAKKRKLRHPTGPQTIQGSGIVQGHLMGGCVEVMEMLKGTDYWPEKDKWKGAILFLETSEEGPDVTHFTRWIRNYGSQGILSDVNGILLARPGGQLNDEQLFQYDKALKDVVSKELGLTNLPIITQMDFGHTDPMFVLPYGVQAKINCDKESFSILESGIQ